MTEVTVCNLPAIATMAIGEVSVGDWALWGQTPLMRLRTLVDVIEVVAFGDVGARIQTLGPEAKVVPIQPPERITLDWQEQETRQLSGWKVEG